MLYELLKAGHLVAIVIWFGGMMLAALALTHGRGEMMERLRIWDRSVTAPAMIGTWALGLTLAVWGNWFASGGWMSVKLVFVLVLSAVHGILSGRLRRTAADGEAAAVPALRLALPAMMVSLLVIALLVVTKPF
jgi:uncharacterized membrane protein